MIDGFTRQNKNLAAYKNTSILNPVGLGHRRIYPSSENLAGSPDIRIHPSKPIRSVYWANCFTHERKPGLVKGRNDSAVTAKSSFNKNRRIYSSNETPASYKGASTYPSKPHPFGEMDHPVYP